MARNSSGAKKTLLVGAGHTGNAVLQDLHRAESSKYEIVCVVDDDPDKVGRTIQRVRVAGSTRDIPKLVDKHGIEVIILLQTSKNAEL